jgi:hypothetical protein
MSVPNFYVLGTLTQEATTARDPKGRTLLCYYLFNQRDIPPVLFEKVREIDVIFAFYHSAAVLLTCVQKDARFTKVALDHAIKTNSPYLKVLVDFLKTSGQTYLADHHLVNDVLKRFQFDLIGVLMANGLCRLTDIMKTDALPLCLKYDCRPVLQEALAQNRTYIVEFLLGNDVSPLAPIPRTTNPVNRGIVARARRRLLTTVYLVLTQQRSAKKANAISISLDDLTGSPGVYPIRLRLACYLLGAPLFQRNLSRDFRHPISTSKGI